MVLRVPPRRLLLEATTHPRRVGAAWAPGAPPRWSTPTS